MTLQLSFSILVTFLEEKRTLILRKGPGDHDCERNAGAIKDKDLVTHPLTALLEKPCGET